MRYLDRILAKNPNSWNISRVWCLWYARALKAIKRNSTYRPHDPFLMFQLFRVH